MATRVDRPGRRTGFGLALILALVYSAVVAMHLLWDAHTHRMPTFDQASHLSEGIGFAQAIASGTFLRTLWSGPAMYPPGYQVLLGAGTWLAGPSPAMGLY